MSERRKLVRMLRRLADRAHEAGCKDLSCELHDAARREEDKLKAEGQ